MLDTIFGLPIHILIVHATVVIVPTAAVAVIAAVASSRFRAWAGPLPAALAVVALILTPITTSSGEELERRVAASKLVAEHTELGGLLIYWVVPLAVLAAALWFFAWNARRGSGPTLSGTLTKVAGGLAVVVAIGTLVQVVLIGHSGAQASWSDVGSSASSSSASGNGD